MDEIVLDVEEMAKWISEQSGIDIDSVNIVLDLETSYMEDKGLIESIEESE